jgi:hypothetical protein
VVSKRLKVFAKRVIRHQFFLIEVEDFKIIEAFSQLGRPIIKSFTSEDNE